MMRTLIFRNCGSVVLDKLRVLSCGINLMTTTKTRNDKWEAIIGLEIHAQIQAKSKLFSSSETSFGISVNNAVSFLDASLPGTLPVLNKVCVRAAVKTAYSLNCTINKVSFFDRKHYFYADLPSGYQITQNRKPIAVGGSLKYLTIDPFTKKLVEKEAGLIQIQLEQDSGKSLHDIIESRSLIDLNRAGTGLLEIVTQPDFKSSVDAIGFVKELQLLLQTINVCNGKMEEGSFRVDASVSIRKLGDTCLGVRTEIKNLNSIRSLGRAIDHEILRQVELLVCGKEILNETRHYDVEKDITVSLRDKENVHDYRFMPEPNISPLILFYNNKDPYANGICIDCVIKDIPSLPREKRSKLVEIDGLSLEQSDILVNHPFLFAIYRKSISNVSLKQYKNEIANFLINEMLSIANKFPKNTDKLKSFMIKDILVMLLVEKTINLTISKKILEFIMMENSETLSCRDIVKVNKWYICKDDELLKDVCMDIIAQHPQTVKSYKDGKVKALHFLVGQVQKKLKNQGDGSHISKMLLNLINK